MEINYQDGFNSELVQFPFGFGLSYTNYEYSDFEMASSANINDHAFEISCKVKNVGKVDGTEIVQLYVSPQNPDSKMKAILLKGFHRVSLKSGEEKELTFRVSPQLLAQYLNRKWVIEPGSYNFV